MPDRVVTVNLQATLAGANAVILAATTRPYNPDGLPPVWSGGYYVDMIVEVDSLNLDDVHGDAWEFGATTPARLTEGTGRHTFLGWPRYETKADATPDDGPDPFLSRRRTVLTFDVGGLGGRRFRRNLDIIPLATGMALEMIVDAPADNANLVGPDIYDALDDHPVALRDALEARGTNRRVNAAQPATDWNERRPDV